MKNFDTIDITGYRYGLSISLRYGYLQCAKICHMAGAEYHSLSIGSVECAEWLLSIGTKISMVFLIMSKEDAFTVVKQMSHSPSDKVTYAIQSDNHLIYNYYKDEKTVDIRSIIDKNLSLTPLLVSLIRKYKRLRIDQLDSLHISGERSLIDAYYKDSKTKPPTSIIRTFCCVGRVTDLRYILATYFTEPTTIIMSCHIGSYYIGIMRQMGHTVEVK